MLAVVRLPAVQLFRFLPTQHLRTAIRHIANLFVRRLPPQLALLALPPPAAGLLTVLCGWRLWASPPRQRSFCGAAQHPSLQLLSRPAC